MLHIPSDGESGNAVGGPGGMDGPEGAGPRTGQLWGPLSMISRFSRIEFPDHRGRCTTGYRDVATRCPKRPP